MKCKCITCTHIAEITKLIPDDILRNKVLAVTDGLYEAMAGENIELEQINELLREQNEAIVKANTKVEKEIEDLKDLVKAFQHDAD